MYIHILQTCWKNCDNLRCREEVPYNSPRRRSVGPSKNAKLLLSVLIAETGGDFAQLLLFGNLSIYFSQKPTVTCAKRGDYTTTLVNCSISRTQI